MTDAATCKTCGQQFEYDRLPGIPVGFGPTICADCAGKAAAAEAMEERRAARIERNVPPRYAATGFETFNATTLTQGAALEAMRDHARQGVFLIGPPGCGKTHLATAAIMAGPAGSLFVSTTELLDDIRAGFNGDGHGLFERAKRSSLLALDDLGSEAVKDFVRDRLYTLLNWRWNQSMPVIVTTNCRPSTISDRIGEAGVSRVTGLCQRRVEMKGPDGRRALQVAS